MPLYSHEPASTSLAIRALKTRRTRGTRRAGGRATGTGLKNRCIFVRWHFRRERRVANCARASSLSYDGDRWLDSPIACRSMSATGRNDPCPCGSGRKFKHCCLRAIDAEDAARVRLRTAEGVLVPALFAYAADEFGDEFFDEAWEEFFLGSAVPENIDSSREFGTTFDPFFVFSFVPDAKTDLPPGWPIESVALHFLHQEVESCPDFHREFIEQACRSHPIFFAVESTAPGRSINLKDILTGRHFRVLEQSASRTLRAGDLTFTRVVTAGGASIMIGASPWVIPPSWHLPVIEFRDQLSPRRLMTLADLSSYDIEIRRLYHQIADAIENPRLPTLQNTDGDPIELTTMTYDLGVTAAEAFDRLRPLATLRGEAHVDDERYDAAGGIEAAVLTWLKAGNRKHKDWDNTTLGTLRLDGSRLVIEVNSAKRRKRIAKEISKRFGSRATLVETKTADIVRELQERRAGRGETAEPMTFSSEPERTPEIQALEAELMQRHWDAWIDTKVPALGNRTPRQAAKTPKGRERLEALLSDFARSTEQRSPKLEPDLADLRRRLGLA